MQEGEAGQVMWLARLQHFNEAQFSAVLYPHTARCLAEGKAPSLGQGQLPFPYPVLTGEDQMQFRTTSALITPQPSSACGGRSINDGEVVKSHCEWLVQQVQRQ